MLAAYCNTNDETTKCASLLGTVTPQHQESGGLISENTSLLAPDVSGDCTDTCSFYSGPSDATIMAFGESCETNGSIAYYGGETSGSIAYSGSGESCGSIASSFSGGGFSGGSSSSSGGGCSYSC